MASAANAYGLDYSARELSPREIDEFNRANPNTPISFLIRYIGYPSNRKCISAYPGALRAHEESGRPVMLVHQVAYQDFAGGRAAGVAHAHIAVGDAQRAGWRWDRPIFAAFDRWLNSHDPKKGIYPIAPNTVREYVAGFRSVLGDLAGLYGFWDVMRPCVAENWVPWRWQCGAESDLVAGVQFYQSNRGFVYPGGLQSDLNKSVVGLTLEDDMNIWDVVNFRPNRNQNVFDAVEQIQLNQEAHGAILAAIANDQDVTPDELDRIVNDAVERHAAKAEDIAKAMAADVATEVVARLPHNEDGTLAVDINEELIAAEVINLAGRKLGAV